MHCPTPVAFAVCSLCWRCGCSGQGWGADSLRCGHPFTVATPGVCGATLGASSCPSLSPGSGNKRVGALVNGIVEGRGGAWRGVEGRGGAWRGVERISDGEGGLEQAA